MGGSSGGGGSSGAVDYPSYMKAIHCELLAGNSDFEHVTPPAISTGNSVLELYENGINNNPWLGADAYNPSTELTTMATVLSTLNNDNVSAISGYESYINNLSSTTQIESELSAFDIGMRNVNAVHGSGFIIGRSIIASGLLKEKLVANQTLAQLKLDTNNKNAALAMEVARIGIVAHKEERDMNNELDHKYASWSFDVMQLTGNVIAAIAGGTVSVPKEGPSKVQSAIGGGLSGAAAGAMTGAAIGAAGGPIGALGGAAIGGALGIAQAFL